MNEYEKRQHAKAMRDKYRDAARRLNPNASVRPYGDVQVTADEDGAFVECTVWVSREEAEAKQPSMRHALTCRAYGNYQPPYEECTCGAEL